MALRNLHVQFHDEAVLIEGLIAVGFELGLVVGGFRCRQLRLLIETLILQAHFQVRVSRFGGLHVPLGGHQGSLQFGIGQLQQEGIGSHRCARQQNFALHPSVGGSGDTENVFRNQRAQATHIEHHLPALDGVRPNRGALDGLGRGLQPSQSDGDRRNRDGENHSDRDPPDQPASGSAFTRDIHVLIR